MKVAVVTPTVASNEFAACLKSVQEQTYDDLTHYIFIDGESKFDLAMPMLSAHAGKKTIKTIALEENIGKGWYGHRVYAACSFLVNADVIVYLDEDNWIEPNHVETLVNLIKTENLSWAYSLRKIYDKDSNFICEDNCESLGMWPIWYTKNNFHIDTSCFAVKREVAVRVGHAWYGQWGADRVFFDALLTNFPKFNCTKEYSLCYRLGGNESSVQKSFFLEGNETNKEKYKGEFPWRA